MSYHTDWVMKQIELMGKFIAKIAFNKEEIKYNFEDKIVLSDADLLYISVKKLVDKKQYAQAEKTLLEGTDYKDNNYLELGCDFYERLNKLDDEELEANGFSREQIQSGMEKLMDNFGFKGLPF